MAKGEPQVPLNIWNPWLREGHPEIPGPAGWGVGMGPIPPSQKTAIDYGNQNGCRGHSIECADNYSGVRSTPCCTTGEGFFTVMDSSVGNEGENREETCMRNVCICTALKTQHRFAERCMARHKREIR